MKNYSLYAVFSSFLVTLFFWLILSNYLIQTHSQHYLFSFLSVENRFIVIGLLTLNAVFTSLISWLYLTHDDPLADGLLSGLILGFGSALILGLYLMLNVEQLPLTFLQEDMTNFLALVVLIYSVIGLFNGCVFKLMVKNEHHASDKNNLYPCIMNTNATLLADIKLNYTPGSKDKNTTPKYHHVPTTQKCPLII